MKKAEGRKQKAELLPASLQPPTSSLKSLSPHPQAGTRLSPIALLLSPLAFSLNYDAVRLCYNRLHGFAANRGGIL